MTNPNSNPDKKTIHLRNVSLETIRIINVYAAQHGLIRKRGEALDQLIQKALATDEKLKNTIDSGKAK